MYKESIINGFKKGLETLWSLSKIVVPIYIFVTFLGYTPILNKISNFFKPAMNIIGLPGEASLVIVLGNFVGLYAGVGAMAGLTLTTKQSTIIATMLTFSHSLFVETAVSKKVGMSSGVAVLVRVTLAILSATVLNIIM